MSSNKAKSGSGGVPFEAIYIGTSQKKAFTAASAQSTALGSKTSVVRLYATQDCHIKTGTNPTAVADGTCLFLPADTIAHIGVNAADKIAVIRDSADGNLFITEGA
jgi:hypothetical protein